MLILALHTNAAVRCRLMMNKQLFRLFFCCLLNWPLLFWLVKKLGPFDLDQPAISIHWLWLWIGIYQNEILRIYDNGRHPSSARRSLLLRNPTRAPRKRQVVAHVFHQAGLKLQTINRNWFQWCHYTFGDDEGTLNFRFTDRLQIYGTHMVMKPVPDPNVAQRTLGIVDLIQAWKIVLLPSQFSPARQICCKESTPKDQMWSWSWETSQ